MQKIKNHELIYMNSKKIHNYCIKLIYLSITILLIYTIVKFL
jgi:hypothetical protein